MDVLLYRVGRNLNRAYRTAASFGVRRLLLKECTEQIQGNLFSALGQVQVINVDAWPPSFLGLEPGRGVSLVCVDWSKITTVAIGGESVTLPRASTTQWAHIPTLHGLCLTTEAALAIALYAWQGGATREA